MGKKTAGRTLSGVGTAKLFGDRRITNLPAVGRNLVAVAEEAVAYQVIGSNTGKCQ
jgi:hypothetical protein